MPRKGKEPAGLRRWRLAHRPKRRRVRRLKTKVVRYTARRRRGFRRKGRKGSKAIPVLIALPALLPAWNAYRISGATSALPEQLMYRYTGYHKDAGFQTSVLMAAATPIIVGIVGHKIANRFGLNKVVKKFTMGIFQL